MLNENKVEIDENIKAYKIKQYTANDNGVLKRKVDMSTNYDTAVLVFIGDWHIGTVDFDIEEAIKVITSNVADILKLDNKGKIEPGKDADFVIVNNKSLEIDKVIAKGKIVVENGRSIIKPTFE